eukprot:4868093-Alexandrium_andersonii.AAC.1
MRARARATKRTACGRAGPHRLKSGQSQADSTRPVPEAETTGQHWGRSPPGRGCVARRAGAAGASRP